MRKRTKYILISIAAFFILLLVVGYLVFRSSTVQTWLSNKIANYYEKKLGTEIKIGGVDIEFFKTIVLEDFYVEDQHGDTLLFAREFKADIQKFRARKKKLYLNFTGLENSKLYISRHEGEKVYNYEFIVDYFEKDRDREADPWDVKMDKVEVINTRFRFFDEPQKTHVTAYLPFGDVDFEDFDPINNTIVAEYAIIDRANVEYTVLPGEKVFSKVDTNDVKPWKFGAGNLKVNNSSFKLDNENQPAAAPNQIDWNHLHVTDINIDLNDGSVEDYVYTADINTIALREKSGFELKQLAGQAIVSSEEITVENLRLITNNSNIGNYFSMQYAGWDDFKNFVHEVNMAGRFKNAKVDVGDIAFFAPGIGEMADEQFVLSGNISGRVDNLKGRDMDLYFGNRSYFAGGAELRGLPDITTTFIDINARTLQTSAPEMREVLPFLTLPENFNKLGMVNFSGSFTGFTRDFVAYGMMSTALGQVTADVNMKIPSGIPIYTGTLSLSNFELGEWLDQQEKLGIISLDAQIQGQGVKATTFNTNIVADVHELYYNGYTYTNLFLDGNLRRQLFAGELDINDPNVELSSEGTINFAGAVPAFDLTADIQKANLRVLGFSEEETILSSRLRLNFEGDNLDNLLGTIEAYDLTLRRPHGSDISRRDEVYTLDSLILSSILEGGEKRLSLTSDIASGYIKGDFYLSEIPAAFADVVESYFPAYDFPVKEAFHEQDFTISLNIDDTQQFTQFFFPDVRRIKNAQVDGRISTRENIADITASADILNYKGQLIENLAFVSTSKGDVMTINAAVDNIPINDTLNIKDAVLSAEIANNTADFVLNVASDTLDSRAHLRGMLTAVSSDTFNLAFSESELFLDNEEWNLSQGSNIRFGKNFINVEDLRLTQDEQQIVFNYSKANNKLQKMHLAFDDVRLEEIFNLLAPNKTLAQGRINGTFYYSPEQDTGFYSDLVINDFVFNNVELGTATVNTSSRAGEPNRLYIDATIPGNAEISGYYILNQKQNNLNLTAELTEFQLALLEPFWQEFISDFEGYATGSLKLKGSLTKPQIRGTTTLHDAGLTINFLGAHYTFDDENITFDAGFIDLQDITLFDREGNTADLDGEIYHRNFDDLRFDAFLTTDKFMFINTTAEQNEFFYGEVFARSNIHFKGTFQKLDMNIDATTRSGTDFYIPVNEAKDIGSYDFITFVNAGDTTRQEYKVKLEGITMNMSLTVTPEAKISIIVDPNTGDMISGYGNGDLHMYITTRGDFNMFGTYEILDGSYRFSMQNIVDKRFDIQKGSSITWTGDPYDARLNVTASYRIRASFNDLLPTGNQGYFGGVSNQRVPVYVYLYLTESLLAPDIQFDIEAPSAGGNLAVSSFLQQIENDPNELNKQVFGLLVLNRFLPYGSGIAEGAPGFATEAGAASVSEFLSNQLSYWASQIDPTLDFSIRYTGLYTDPSDPYARQELYLALSKSFFDDRVVVDVGGNVNVGGSDPTQADAGQGILGDFAIEYKITRDGRLRARIFRTASYDIFTERGYKSGIGLSYLTEFDTMAEFWDNFLRRNKGGEDANEDAPDEEEAPEAPPAEESETSTGNQ